MTRFVIPMSRMTQRIVIISTLSMPLLTLGFVMAMMHSPSDPAVQTDPLDPLEVAQSAVIELAGLSQSSEFRGLSTTQCGHDLWMVDGTVILGNGSRQPFTVYLGKEYTTSPSLTVGIAVVDRTYVVNEGIRARVHQ